jgi:nonribosomal peptide synthetase DhbF
MPDTPDLQALVELCAQAIGVKTIGQDDSFVDAGGDSVAAARLAVLAEERWGIELDIFTIIAADSVVAIHDGLVAPGRKEQVS